jgi:hypothetical protein
MRSKLIRQLFLLFLIFSQTVVLGQSMTTFSITNSDNSLSVSHQTGADTDITDRILDNVLVSGIRIIYK